MNAANPTNAPTAATSAGPQTDPQRIAAVIYLSSNHPLHLPDFFTEFHDNWPSLTLEKTGKEPHRVFFRVGRSNFALELHHSQVSRAITEPVANTTLQWPIAAAALEHHVAHIELSGSPTGQSVLGFSCDLTRAIASLLSVTDSLAVCWLNGPALNQARTFTATARELFATGLYPLTLWAAVRWDSTAHTLSTHGMSQFALPELVLAQQGSAVQAMVDYLFQLGLSLINSRHPVTPGETLESPHGRMKVKPGRSSQTGNPILIFESC